MTHCDDLRVLVQARMSSTRFPGKVLAPLAGKAMILHVLERCAVAFGSGAVVLLTSVDRSDDPLAHHVGRAGFVVFRGELENVARRFQQCLEAHRCDWFARISGDSPLIDPELIARVAAARREGLDLVTNVQQRTFPAGQSVEVVRSAGFSRLDASRMTPEEREHVTQVFYRHPERYAILNLRSSDERLAEQRYAVDTPEDLASAERLLREGKVPAFAGALQREAA